MLRTLVLAPLVLLLSGCWTLGASSPEPEVVVEQQLRVATVDATCPAELSEGVDAVITVHLDASHRTEWSLDAQDGFPDLVGAIRATVAAVRLTGLEILDLFEWAGTMGLSDWSVPPATEVTLRPTTAALEAVRDSGPFLHLGVFVAEFTMMDPGTGDEVVWELRSAPCVYELTSSATLALVATPPAAAATAGDAGSGAAGLHCPFAAAEDLAVAVGAELAGAAKVEGDGGDAQCHASIPAVDGSMSIVATPVDEVPSISGEPPFEDWVQRWVFVGLEVERAELADVEVGIVHQGDPDGLSSAAFVVRGQFVSVRLVDPTADEARRRAVLLDIATLVVAGI